MGGQQATFADLLRKLRAEARLTQEELAEASGVRPRSISDLERGVAVTPQRETVRRLADALNLTGPVRTEFEATARGRLVPAGTGGAGGGGASGGEAVTATRTLPRDISSFTGREQQLRALMDAASDAGGVVGIHAIGGMAGVGKTAFAVHAAHRLADRFPAGQIFLSLHGHTPGRQPVGPADALASLLANVGVPAGQIPADVAARTALRRDRLAERQLLLILDDAASSEQVLPLLPGAGGSLVLVTSRRHLSALEDATAISLDTLPASESAALLTRLAGRPGLRADDSAVGAITRLCGHLPLAIGMVARQLHHHPSWSVAGRGAELAAARDRLGLMATENLSVAAAFDLSYADLTDDQQRLFRRLGLHPGGEFNAHAAAALDDIELSAARRRLETLYDHYLLIEPAQGRYRMHDLIREHARALVGRLDPDDDRDRAMARLLDYYQQTAARAQAHLGRQTRPGLAAADEAVMATVSTFAGLEQALAWARAERTSLLACLDYATETGQHARVVALTAGLAGLLRRDGPWAEAITRHTVAIEAARQLGDRLGQANALHGLGIGRMETGDLPGAAQAMEQMLGICRDLGDRLGQANALRALGAIRQLTGDYEGAVQAVEQALDIYRDLGDPLGQAEALGYLGVVRRRTGDYQGAVQALEQALGSYRELGDRFGQANASNELGAVRRLTGDYQGAAQALTEAVSIFHDIGSRAGEAEALNESGTLYRLNGDLAQAEQCHRQALELARVIAKSWQEAPALAGLGRCALAAGHAAEGEALLRQALEIFQRVGAAETTDLVTELDALTGHAR